MKQATSEQRYKTLRQLIREAGHGQPYVDARSKGASVKLPSSASETLKKDARRLADEVTHRSRTHGDRGFIYHDVERYLFFLPKWVETYNRFPRKEHTK